MQGISYYIILGFIVITLLVSLFKKHNAYESFIKGAKESMKMGISLFPYLLIMIVSVESFKASRLLNDLFKEAFKIKFSKKLLDEYGKQYDGLKISKGTDEFMEQLVH